MHKAINMQADVQLAGGEDAVRQALQSAFAHTNPDLKLTIKGLSPGKTAGTTRVRVYIEGEQEPAAPFAQLAGDALHKAIAAMESDSRARDIQEVEDDDDSGLVLPPGHTAHPTPPPAEAAGTETGAVAAPSSTPPTPETRDLNAPSATLGFSTPTVAPIIPPPPPVNVVPVPPTNAPILPAAPSANAAPVTRAPAPVPDPQPATPPPSITASPASAERAENPAPSAHTQPAATSAPVTGSKAPATGGEGKSASSDQQSEGVESRDQPAREAASSDQPVEGAKGGPAQAEEAGGDNQPAAPPALAPALPVAPGQPGRSGRSRRKKKRKR